MKRSSFLEKTVILTVTNIFTGTLVFLYSIILSREVGSKGMGLYQLVMPLYMLFLCITGGGITVTISKIAAEKKATGNMNELYRTVKVISIFEFLWSMSVTAIVAISAGILSSNVLSDTRTLYGILAFCPALVIISISSVYKGVFYGVQRVLEPALIDLGEKIARVAAMYFLVNLTRSYGIEISAAAAVFAMTIGEFISLVLLYGFYKNYVRKHPTYGKCDNGFQLTFNVLKLAVPLALNGILSTIFSTVTTVMIPKRLQVAGLPYEEALSMLGKLQGMALNIAFYPAIVIGALNVLLIPSISEAVTFKKNHIVNHRLNTAITIASITAFSSSAIIFAMPFRLAEFFYRDPAVGEILRVITLGIPIAYIESITFSILNGLGKQANILINSTIISTIDLGLLYIFLGIPSLNIKGFAISFIVVGLLGIILNFRVIGRSIQYTFNFYSSIILPFLCSAFLYIIAGKFLIMLQSVPLIIIASYAIYLALFIPLYNFSKRHG